MSSCDSYGCAYEIELPYESDCKSYAFECSISQCYGDNSAFYHFQGDIRINNMNSSYHGITEYAAYGIQYPTELGYINFTTASNTSSLGMGGMMNLGNIAIINCNYLNNEYRGVDKGIIYCSRTCTYSNCSFIGNKENYLFYFNPSFENCYFNENTVRQTFYDDSLTIETMEPLDSTISHYITDGCPSAYYNDPLADKTLIIDKFDLEDIKKMVKNVYKSSIFDKAFLGMYK